MPDNTLGNSLPAAGLSSPPISDDPSPIRVLIVDDEKPIRDVIVDILKEEGYQVESAADGDEALKILEKYPADLMITDLEMPRVRGIELLKQTRALPSPPITILMTGFGTVETAIEAMKLGAYDYILKPFKLEEFIELVKKASNKFRFERENVQLKELLSLYRISEAMISTLDLKQLLALIVEIVLSELKADRVAVYFTNDRGLLDLLMEKSKSPGDLALEPLPLDFDRLKSNLENREMFIASGFKLTEVLRSIPDKPASFLAHPQTIYSLVAAPLRLQKELRGFLIAISYDPRLIFTDGHGKSLVIFSSRAVMALENARLYEELAQTLTQTIEGLVAALEAKDYYTGGHSERVAFYARKIAEAMNLDPLQINNITHAARLHDIGKIGIKLDTLNKPGRLTKEEQKMFQYHTQLGKIILEPIKILQDTVPIIFHHHEHFDGKGYPEGKKGEDIPLGARILAVADSYEVMTSDRPYRKARSQKHAVQELKHCSGSQFDPRVVKFFLKIIEAERQALPPKS
ncbi:MAG: response regulator [Proteobacteria bacterium]|nr:response regulator [Pseudomonadota bacterium]